jgi:trehalose-phosphatase
MTQPLSLWNHLKAILDRCMAHTRCLLLLDYDGTLTPIAEHPNAAQLSPAMQQVLALLGQHGRFRLGIVSGRSLADLRAHIDGPGIFLAGNHGLEITAPGVSYLHPEMVRLRPELEALSQALGRDLKAIPGAWVEDKGLTLSIHIRQVPATRVPEVEECLLRHAGPALGAGLLALRTGKAVLEVRPFVAWDKGEAVRWMSAQVYREIPPDQVLLMYIGDDDTDEDAFRVLGHDGIGIVVGRNRQRSAAHYYLDSVEAVGKFLGMLSTLT